MTSSFIVAVHLDSDKAIAERQLRDRLAEIDEVAVDHDIALPSFEVTGHGVVRHESPPPEWAAVVTITAGSMKDASLVAAILSTMDGACGVEVRRL